MRRWLLLSVVAAWLTGVATFVGPLVAGTRSTPSKLPRAASAHMAGAAAADPDQHAPSDPPPPGPARRRKKLRKNWHVVKLYRRAQAASKTGAFDVARTLLNECISIDEHDAHSWLSLARLEARVGEAATARELFERARRICPGNVRLVHAHGVFERRCGRLEEARALFALAGELDPGNAYVSHAWGKLEERFGNASAAAGIYEELMATNPSAPVCIAWAELEAHNGHLLRARRIFEEGWRQYLAPQHHRHTGDAAGSEGGDETHAAAHPSVDGGASATRPPLGAMPFGKRASSDLLLAWAALERSASNLTAARQLLQRAETETPQRAAVQLARAQLETQAKGYPSARHLFQRAAHQLGLRTEARRRATGDHPVDPLATAGSSSEHSSAPGSSDLEDLETFGEELGLEHGDYELHAEGGEPSNDEEALERDVALLFNAWAACEANFDVPSAIRILNYGRNLCPQDASLLQSLGTLRHRAGEHDAARAALQASIYLTPRGATYVAYALLEADCGNHARAAELFTEGASVDPTHAPLHSARASFLAKTGDVNGARQVLRDAVESQPSATLYHGWGRLEERQGDLTAAAELYERGATSAAVRDDTSYLWHSLGCVLLVQRQLPRALAAFEEGLRRAPGSSQLLLGAATVHSQKGRSELGRQHFLKAVQADPAHAQAWQSWGVMEARLGNAAVARDLFERGRLRCPAHAPLWQASAKLEGEAGNHARARQLFRQGRLRCPDNAGLLVGWAYYEIHEGRPRDAADLLRQARLLDDSSGELHHVEAMLYLKLGRPKQAWTVVESGLATAPTHAPLYRMLGALQDNAGMVEEARNSFREGLRLNPGYAQLYHAWARLEGRVMNMDGLAELNKRAKAAFPQPEPNEPPPPSSMFE